MQFLDDWKAKLWSRFFCLSVYVTMYLNDHQRDAFYSSLGLNTKQFNRCTAVYTLHSALHAGVTCALQGKILPHSTEATPAYLFDRQS